MATPLPTGVDQAEAQAIFDDLNTRGAQVGNIAAMAATPNYLVPYVTGQTATLPPGVDSTELTEVMTRANTHGAGVRDRFVVNNTPSYLLPNLGDFYVPQQSETTSWLAAVQARGGNVSANMQLAMNNLINALKTSGVYALLDRLWLFGVENTVQALTDVIGRNVATATNSPTFTPGRGYAGDGATSYINSGFNWQVPSAGANKFTANNCSMGVWIDLMSNQGNVQRSVIGHENGAYSQLYCNNFSGARFAGIMSQTSNIGPWTPASQIGFYHVQRTGAAALAGYGAGGVQEVTGTQASQTNLGNRVFFILANNHPGPVTPIQFSAERVSAAWIGASMTQAQITAFNNALATFMTQAQSTNLPIVFDFMAGVLPNGVTLTRSTVGWSFVQPNTIRNPNMTGAVSGSPGTLPTNWVVGGVTDNMVRTVTAGAGYIDIRFNHQNPTQSSNYDIEFDTRTGIPAQMGQFWQGSFAAQLIAGSVGNANPGIYLLGWNTGQGATETAVLPINLSNQPQTFSISRTLTFGTTVCATHAIRVAYTAGQGYDFTVRIFAPPFFTTPSLFQQAINAARFNYALDGSGLQGLLNEPVMTSYINTSNAGAVLGALPTPGVLPTGWGFNPDNGLTQTIAAFGTLGNGVPYIDVRFNGTSADVGGSNHYMGGNSPGISTPAALNNIFDVSLYLQLIAGSWTNVNNFFLQFTQRDGANAGVGNIVSPTSIRPQIDSVLRRFDFSAQMLGAGIATVQPVFLFNYANGVAIDFTLRIASPQLIQSPVPQAPILGGTTSQTRTADVLRVPLNAGLYNITVQRLAGSEVLLGQSPSGGLWTVPTNPSPVQRVTAVSAFNPANTETTSFIGQVVTNGGTVSADRAALIDNYITGLKRYGIWQLIDDIWMLAAENSQQALTSWKQLRLSTAVNSPTFVIDRGYTFDGATNYVNTGFIPSTHGVAMSGTNMRIAVYERVNQSSGYAAASINSSSQNLIALPRNANNNITPQLNSQTTSTGGDVFTDSRGYSVGARNGTTAADIKAYKNGVFANPAVPGSLSSALATLSIYIGTGNNGAGGTGFRNTQEAQVSVGASLSPIQESHAYNLLQSFMTSIGAQV